MGPNWQSKMVLEMSPIKLNFETWKIHSILAEYSSLAFPIEINGGRTSSLSPGFVIPQSVLLCGIMHHPCRPNSGMICKGLHFWSGLRTGPTQKTVLLCQRITLHFFWMKYFNPCSFYLWVSLVELNSQWSLIIRLSGEQQTQLHPCML